MFTEEEISKAIGRTYPKLKTKSVIKKPLEILFDKSLEEEIIPTSRIRLM